MVVENWAASQVVSQTLSAEVEDVLALTQTAEKQILFLETDDDLSSLIGGDAGGTTAMNGDVPMVNISPSDDQAVVSIITPSADECDRCDCAKIAQLETAKDEIKRLFQAVKAGTITEDELQTAMQNLKTVMEALIAQNNIIQSSDSSEERRILKGRGKSSKSGRGDGNNEPDKKGDSKGNGKGGSGKGGDSKAKGRGKKGKKAHKCKKCCAPTPPSTTLAPTSAAPVGSSSSSSSTSAPTSSSTETAAFRFRRFLQAVGDSTAMAAFQKKTYHWKSGTMQACVTGSGPLRHIDLSKVDWTKPNESFLDQCHRDFMDKGRAQAEEFTCPFYEPKWGENVVERSAIEDDDPEFHMRCHIEGDDSEHSLCHAICDCLQGYFRNNKAAFLIAAIAMFLFSVSNVAVFLKLNRHRKRVRSALDALDRSAQVTFPSPQGPTYHQHSAGAYVVSPEAPDASRFHLQPGQQLVLVTQPQGIPLQGVPVYQDRANVRAASEAPSAPSVAWPEMNEKAVPGQTYTVQGSPHGSPVYAMGASPFSPNGSHISRHSPSSQQ
jgi:hypothetical protein